MPYLKLSLLGPPRIERDSAPVQVDTRKATALLAYLAVTGTGHSRDTLAALFWPDYDEAHARAALRRTLSTLKQALAGAWLDADRETIALQRGPEVWLDVDEFHARLAGCRSHSHPADQPCPDCLRPLSDAVRLYRDDFMAGFTLRDSAGFDDWQFFQSASLRGELASALENLVRCYIEQGELAPAIDCARRWLALDPLHEPAHRQLMRLYAWTGQRAAALRQYRECVRVLDQELGVSPLDETTQLSQAIEENRLPPPQRHVPIPTQGAPSPRQAPNTQYPLIGRSAEWMALLNAYSHIHADGHWVILEGEAGIGKTRLAEEFLEHVQARGASVVRAQCYEGETGLAYGPFVEGLRAAIAQASAAQRVARLPTHWQSEAARLLPELSALPPALPLDGPGAQSRFLEGITQVILAVCGSAPPGVLFMDDVQWMDSASLDLLTYLVKRLRGRPVLILTTWRDEPRPSLQRLHAVLAEARRADAATILELPRLSQADVMQLVQSGQALPADLHERLYRETEGVPFFLVEYLAALSHSGETAASANWSLPRQARDILRSRLALASETGQQLLSAAAVIGRSFDFDTWREASGRCDDEIITALEALIAQGLVKEVRGGEASSTLIYDFTHEKLRALVYEETSLARRRLLHRRVAETLVTRARRGERALTGQIAQHYHLAGQDADAAVYYQQAGEQARALYANAQALEHFRMALALGYAPAADLHEAIGDLQTLAGDYGAALTCYETAAALGDSTSLGRLEHKLGNVHHRLGEWERADCHFQAALAAWGDAGAQGERARVYADWSLTAHRQGRADQSRDLAQCAMELAQAAGDARALAQAHNLLGILASSQDDWAQAAHHLERSLELAQALNDPGARAAALNNLALASGGSGEIDRAISLAEQALALCAAQGDRHREAALHNNLADLLHAAGRSEAAMSHLKQAVTIFSEIADFSEIAQSGDRQPEIWKLTEW